MAHDARRFAAAWATAASAGLLIAAPAALAAPEPAPAPTTPAAPYETIPGAPQAAPSFSIKYTGSSWTRTTYRGTPPNPTGKHDINTARDESRQTWALTYPAGLAIPACGGEPDPCLSVAGPITADGRASATGKIDHDHIDGIYKQLDSEVSCRVKATRIPKKGMRARIDVTYDPATAAFTVAPKNPIEEPLLLLPGVCLEMPDGIDRILSNYFMPGFSFSQDYGPDRWFTPRPVVIPADVWRNSARIRLRVGLSPEGRSPRDCAKRFKYERCRTTGSWSGTLTFTRR